MSNELVEKVREDDRAMLLKTVMRTIERLAIPGETLASVATAAVNLVLDECDRYLEPAVETVIIEGDGVRRRLTEDELRIVRLVLIGRRSAIRAMKVAKLREAVEPVLLISDRKHEAWDRLKLVMEMTQND